MWTIENVSLIALGYLLGSIPTAVWVSKTFYGLDVRNHGSNNAGATNTFRVLGPQAGVPVLLVDITKGWLAVSLAGAFSGLMPGSAQMINLELCLAIAALIGHIYPLFAQFDGGKGIATLFGAIIAIHFQGALTAVGIFLIMFLIFRFVSLASIVAAITFPLVLLLIYKETHPSLIVFAVAIAVTVVVTHKQNIGRLLRKEEKKIKLRRPRSKHNDLDNPTSSQPNA